MRKCLPGYVIVMVSSAYAAPARSAADDRIVEVFMLNMRCLVSRRLCLSMREAEDLQDS